MQRCFSLALLWAAATASVCNLEGELPPGDNDALVDADDEQLLVQTKARVKTKKRDAPQGNDPWPTELVVDVNLVLHQVPGFGATWSDAMQIAEEAPGCLPTCEELESRHIGSTYTSDQLLVPVRPDTFSCYQDTTSQQSCVYWCTCNGAACVPGGPDLTLPVGHELRNVLPFPRPPREPFGWVNVANISVTQIYIVRCPPGCSACSDHSTCTGCVDGMVLTPEGKCECVDGMVLAREGECECVDGMVMTRSGEECVTECPEGLFEQEGRCEYCYRDLPSDTAGQGLACRECTEYPTCTRCLSGNVQYQGRCERECPPSTVSIPYPAQAFGTWCGDCEDANCADCEIANKCSMCKRNFYLLSPGAEATFGEAHDAIRQRAQDAPPMPGGLCFASCDGIPGVYGVGEEDRRFCAPCGTGCRVCIDDSECQECYDGLSPHKHDNGQCVR